MPKQITVTDSTGASRVVTDNPENRALAQQHGFKIDESLIDKAVGFLKGNYDESLGGRITKKVVDAGLDAAGIKRTDHDPTLPDHTGKITVVDAAGGRREVSDVPENRQLAAQHGFKIESADETKANDIASLPQYQGAEGAGHVFQAKAFSEYLFGLPEMARESEMTPAQKMAWEKIKDNHSTASAVGSGLGIAGNILTPGLNMGGEAGIATKAEGLAVRAMKKIGIDAAEGLGSKVVVGAAKGAASGAVYSAPHALGQAVFNDDDASAEGMMLGIGIGAALGGAGPLASKFASVVKPWASQKAGEFAESRVARALGGGEAAESLARPMLDAGAVKPGMRAGKLADAAEATQLAVLDKRVVENPNLAEHGFNTGNVLQSIADDVAATKSGPFYAKEMRMTRDAMKRIVETASGEAPKLQGTLEEQIAQLASMGAAQSPVSFETAQKIQDLFKSGIEKASERGEIERKIGSAIAGEISDAAERIAGASGTELFDRAAQKAAHGSSAIGSILGVAKHVAFGAAAHGGLAAAAPALPAILAGVAGKKILESSPFQTTVALGADRLMRSLAAEHVAGKFAELEQALSKLAVRGKDEALQQERVKGHDVSPISTIVGGSERDPRKALDEFDKKITPLMQSPEKLQNRIQSISNTIGDSGDQGAAMSYLGKQIDALQYLHDSMPKAKPKLGLWTNPEYRPTNAEIRDFEERCAAASDPFYLVRKIEDGTLKGAHLEAAQRAFPALTDMIRRRIESMGYENATESDPKTLRYAARQRLAAMTPSVVDPTLSPALTARLQAGYGKKKQGGGDAGMKLSKPMKSIGSVATPADRIGNS